MIVYVVAKANVYADYDVSILILGVFKDKEDAEKCFTDYILNGEERDLTDREKEGLDNGFYWYDGYKIILNKEEVYY